MQVMLLKSRKVVEIERVVEIEKVVEMSMWRVE